MKVFVVIAALIAVAATAPNQGYGGGNSYGGGYGQTIPMQSAGSPPVRNVPNSSYGYSNPVTYTAPGATYQAAPVTYAAPMLTFHPPSINYRDQSITYATSAQDGYSGTQAYQPSSGYSAPAAPQIQSYQSGGYQSGGYQSGGY